MTVKDLIRELENFDGDMPVRIGMRQRYGSNFAMEIEWDIEERTINAYYGSDYEAVVITEGEQCGSVDYKIGGYYE